MVGEAVAVGRNFRENADLPYSYTQSNSSLDNYRPMVYNTDMTPEELRDWRARNGHSQGKLAAMLKVDVMTIIDGKGYENYTPIPAPCP